MENSKIFAPTFYICCILTLVFASYSAKRPIVNTKYGPVVGLTKYSRYGRSYSSFRGIPYAKSPVGELRFKAPEPPEPWHFPVDATQDAPFCIQKDTKVEGKEDCLYLNVYSPTIKQELLPVMVFIHWGGFIGGQGTSDFIGPEYIMDKDVILVTFNYRLGVFGFFSTLDDVAPGNFGLKDQVMALKFVQENIEYFGGDKHRVTIFGQSAGGNSVSLHLISPSSKGLFQQAISQSGVAMSMWTTPLNDVHQNTSAVLATLVGCADQLGNNSDIVQCLRKVDAVDLVESGDNFKYFSGLLPLTPYPLVTEKKTAANPDPFLTKRPLEYLIAGEFQKVPWIVGDVQDEGIVPVSPIVRQPDILKQLNDNFTTLLSELLVLQFSVGENKNDLFKKIVNFYLDGDLFIDINNSANIQGFIDLMSDRYFHYPAVQNVILQSQKGHAPIWLYNFNYKGEYTYGDLFAATENNINFTWGVSHCDELLYLFRSPAFLPDLRSKADLQMSDVLLTLWTNFAIFGDPDPHQRINWKSLNFDSTHEIKIKNLEFLNITGSFTTNTTMLMQKGFYTNRAKFWSRQNIVENFPDLS